MAKQPENLTGIQMPPPVLTLIHLVAAFLLGYLFPLPAPVPGWVALSGWVIVLPGLILVIWAGSMFNQAQTPLHTYGGTTKIVGGGPYRFSRNPIYLGYICMLVGFPLCINMIWGLILAPVLIILINKLVIEHEETYLERKFKQEYLDYKSKVRRWL
jgi:protein-S-isoprenylcysteine O-methyltransferase Ste14